MGRFSGSGAACWGTQSNKKMVTCSNKHSRSSISFFNLISKEIRKTEVGVNPRSAPFGRMLNRRASIQVSETDDEGIIHVPQWMRPHTGLGKTSAEGEWRGSSSHTCYVVRGSVRLHANGLVFYLGLACKGSRAKPRCNTRSHRLHGRTSLARYKYSEHHYRLSTAFSLFLTSQGHGTEEGIFLFSLRDTPAPEF